MLSSRSWADQDFASRGGFHASCTAAARYACHPDRMPLRCLLVDDKQAFLESVSVPSNSSATGTPPAPRSRTVGPLILDARANRTAPYHTRSSLPSPRLAWLCSRQARSWQRLPWVPCSWAAWPRPIAWPRPDGAVRPYLPSLLCYADLIIPVVGVGVASEFIGDFSAVLAFSILLAVLCMSSLTSIRRPLLVPPLGRCQQAEAAGPLERLPAVRAEPPGPAASAEIVPAGRQAGAPLAGSRNDRLSPCKDHSQWRACARRSRDGAPRHH